MPFPYLRRSHVRVGYEWDYFDDTLVDELFDPIGFTWISDTTIRLTDPPAGDRELTILRNTPKGAQLVQWTDASNLQSFDQNTADLQILYIVQELLDRSRYAALSESANAADFASEAGFAQGANIANQALRLQTARQINGVPFNGTANITVRAAPSHSVYKTVYVSPQGSNTSTGRNDDRPFLSPERAVEYILDQQDAAGWTIKLLGDAITGGELPLPDFTTVNSANMQRRAVIRPVSSSDADAQKNVFQMGNGCHLYGLKFTGWRVDRFDNPSTGFAMAFRPGAIILPGGVPYGQNCVVTAALTDVPTPLPGDAANGNPAQPRGGGCAIADGSVLSAYSVYPNIMTWGFTPASKNGIGYVAKNRAHINCVNAIGLGQHKHFMCLAGGNMVLSGCSSQFGDYSLWSEGTVPRIEPLKVAPGVIASSTGAQAAIAGIKTALVSAASAYINGLRTWTATQQALYAKDTGLLADAIGVCLEYGTDEPMRNVADGFFKFDGLPVLPYSQLADWKLSWTFIRNFIKTNTSFSSGVDAFIDALFARLVATLDNYFFEVGSGPAPSPVERVRVIERSLLTAIAHQWSGSRAGTQFFRVPPPKVARAISRSIVRRNGGRIIFSGQDDSGNARFVGGLTIDARSGQLGGPPFDSALRSRITRAVISRSY